MSVKQTYEELERYGRQADITIENLEMKLAESQREFRAADATIENMQMQVEKLAAENAWLKAGIGFFSYDSRGCYEEHDTAEKAVAYAEDSISEYRDNAPDGWSDEVGSVVWGVIMQRATMTGLRPVTEEDNVAPHIEEFCDYTLLPNMETQATDAFLAEVRSQGVEMFANELGNVHKQLRSGSNHAHAIKSAVFRAVEFAAQLRKGVQS